MEQVTLQDKANNLATFRMDNPLVQAAKINITGDACDNTAPILQSLTLDNRDVNPRLWDLQSMVGVLAHQHKLHSLPKFQFDL